MFAFVNVFVNACMHLWEYVSQDHESSWEGVNGIQAHLRVPPPRITLDSER